MTADPARNVAAWLAAGAGEARPADKVIETSIARVFLFGDRALKLKKPVDFGFLDFTTVEQRRWASEREVAFNRETAPDLYRGVHAITREADGDLALDGAGEAVDWVVEMRRFDDTALLSKNPHEVDGPLAETLGREIARFHIGARRSEDTAGLDCIAYVLNSNAHLLRLKADEIGAQEVERLIADTQAEFERVAPLLLERGETGFARRCHGDLHLGNIVVEHGRPVLFDCIEFNDTISRIDVLYDLAFLLMDLNFRDVRPAANRALNAWLDEAARGFPAQGLWAGLKALPLFQSVRAAVRAHVTVNQDDVELARRYVAAAQGHLAPAAPKLMAAGGYSGSGKSTFARERAPDMGGSPGAVVLRSDEIRKRLWGKGPLDRLPPEAYGPGQSERVYGAMFDAARDALAGGAAVVLDAAFLRPHERAAAEGLARRAGLGFEGVWMDAAPDVLRARIAARTGDASDADVKVLEGQLALDVGEIGWRRARPE
jgi:aminoglycoside phosphotransferase family enzyme/predicted kinase